MSAGNRTGTEALWGLDVMQADGGVDAAGRRFLVLPSVTEPRLVLPTRPHRAAGTILRALRDKTSLTSRVRTAAARALLTTGARSIHLPDPDLLGVVTEELPADEYVYGVHLGPPRANRKPVLALATTRGELVAFVKYGVDELTDHLVRREAEALPMLDDLRSVQVPHLLATGEHRGHPFVIQTPVATTWAAHTDPAAVSRAQVEVAEVGRSSVDISRALDATSRRWRQRVDECAPSASDDTAAVNEVTAFNDVAQDWVQQMRATSVPWGSWHGDWRRTNMAVTAAGCSVWDWERFDSDVPAGYDALHLFLTSRAPTVRDLATLPVDLYDNAATLLGPFDVCTPGDVELVTTGYLLELAGRYLDDHQTHAGARLGAVGEWLLPHLSTRLAHRPSPPPTPTGERGVSES